MRQVRVYTASKLCHAEMWKQYRVKFPELYFTARWPFYVEKISDSSCFAKQFWQDDAADIARSDVVLVYAANAEEKLRGALVEAGIGIALGKAILVVGDNPDFSTWQFHPLVTRLVSLERAFTIAWQLPRLELSCP